MSFSGLLNWILAALNVGGWRAPLLMKRYAELVVLNRTSKNRIITSVPPRTDSSSPITTASPQGTPNGDVVIPAYNNYHGTISLLDTLINDDSFKGRIILVHDCSTDSRLSPALRDFASQYSRVTLLENERNLGFVQTCNRGMAETTRDVVILNTDIGLPVGAVRRILKRLQSNTSIATVTPFSNLAYGMGLPELLYENTFPFRASIAEIDSALQAISRTGEIVLPAGVGFCMGISRRALLELGGFDEKFGLGYGEETDFCLRADAAGMKNILVNDAYVAHERGKSFGTTWQDKSRKGTLKVLARHPAYVRGHLEPYLRKGETRAIAFAALVHLAEKLSGNKTRIVRDDPPDSAPTISAPECPELIIKETSRSTDATLNYAGETFRFRFADRKILDQALALA